MNQWYFNSFIAMVGFSISAIIVKYLDLKPAVILMYLFLISSIFYIIHNFRQSIVVSSKQFILLLILGILGYMSNYFGVLGLKQAPNPGFNMAVVESKIILISILSVIIFNSKFALINLVGICLITIGIILTIRG